MQFWKRRDSCARPRRRPPAMRGRSRTTRTAGFRSRRSARRARGRRPRRTPSAVRRRRGSDSAPSRSRSGRRRDARARPRRDRAPCPAACAPEARSSSWTRGRRASGTDRRPEGGEASAKPSDSSPGATARSRREPEPEVLGLVERGRLARGTAHVPHEAVAASVDLARRARGLPESRGEMRVVEGPAPASSLARGVPRTRRGGCGWARKPRSVRQAKIGVTTLPCTSVSRWSRPPWRKVSCSWSIPSSARSVAWRSWTSTLSTAA